MVATVSAATFTKLSVVWPSNKLASITLLPLLVVTLSWNKRVSCAAEVTVIVFWLVTCFKVGTFSVILFCDCSFYVCSHCE